MRKDKKIITTDDKEIKLSPPPLLKIVDVHISEVAPSFYPDFTIRPSEVSGNAFPWLTADAVICKDCLDELMDPKNKRYHFTFLNSTQGGPRYTITYKLPYDRLNTIKSLVMTVAYQ